MSLLTPDTGLLFWMMISFGIVVFILVKYGFPVILKMVDDRKAYIEESLKMAEKAREELESVRKESALIIEKAHKEQMRILQNASKAGEVLISEAQAQAKTEAADLIEDARMQIRNEK